VLTVERAVEAVIDDLMVGSAVDPYDRPRIIDKLNEALRYCRNRIIEQDPTGSWFSEESGLLTYPASTRWALFTALSATLYAPNRLWWVRTPDSTSGRSVELEIIDVRDELSWIWSHASGQYAVLLRGEKIGIREGQSEDPPASALQVRLLYEPVYTPIARATASWVAESIKYIGTDFPFPKEHGEVVAAYATVLMTMKQETPANDWKTRYNALESVMLASLRKGRNMGEKQRIMTDREYQDDPFFNV
jgi:hypothetical protein